MSLRDVVRRFAWWLAVLPLAALAYVPALASSPGRMPADTKLYLYLDPGRLVSDAPYTFDGRQFAGWVPHQLIAYLWPQGPWYVLGQALGLSDWVTHRLWIGTLFLLAGTGVLWASRRLGLALAAALAAALVYQLAPYLLPYVSRTSAMLLPWAALGWIVGLTVGAATRTRWRDAALFALVIATVGGVNPTALIMIAPAPALWLVIAAAEGRITWRRSAASAVKLAGLSLSVSLWWMTMVVIQGRKGADVLSYSESLEAVSLTSTSPEVWRGLGYWLTYVRDVYSATTTAAADYMVSGRLIAGVFLLAIVGLAGLLATRWAHGRFALALVVTGVVLGVGVHPMWDPSPLMDALVGDGETGLALALRSSTRAVPLLNLGLALGIATLVGALPAWWRAASLRIPVRALVVVAVGLLAVHNLPVLTGARLVDPALERDESPPQAWSDAAVALDAGADGYRVLQLPGAEFGAYRWGYTVDPPLPGMIDRPLVTRDLLPLGSPAAMDLVYGLDDRFQNGVAEVRSVAPVARLLGADTVWLTGDAAFERFRTPRPEIVHDLFARAGDDTGLGPATPYGDPAPNVPILPMVDEQALGDPRVGAAVPPTELVPVREPVPIVRAKSRSVILAGSADGIVDAAAAGLVDGSELLRYAAAEDDLVGALDEAEEVLLTDTNRPRAHHWRGSQDVIGFTESGSPEPEVLRQDDGDERLPVFPDASSASRTIALQEGPVRARATSYGERFAYRPEQRAFMAVDGDPTTAWIAADRAPAEGEQLRLEIDEPIDHLVLRQPDGAKAVRHIGDVSIQVDGRDPIRVMLDERSLEGVGQRVELPPTDGSSTVTLTIETVVVPDPTIGPALAGVGFAEVDAGLAPTTEVVRLPGDVAEAVRASGTDRPVTVVMTRERTRPTNRWRSDPEPAMVREFEVGGHRSFRPQITVRADLRATDATLSDLLGITGAQASSRLTGVATAAGWAATDGDPSTAWITPFGGANGATLRFDTTGVQQDLTLTQRLDDTSPITSVRLVAGDETIDLELPPPDGRGTTTVALPRPLPAGPVALTITGVDPKIVLDRRFGEPVVLPAAVVEISGAAPTEVPERLQTGCRDDLVRIDGVPIEVRIDAAVDDLLAGEPVTAEPCGGAIDLDGTVHRLTTTPGSDTGLHVDRVVLRDIEATLAGDGSGTPASPTATVTSSSRLERTVVVDGCTEGCWLVLGEGLHESWSARTEAGDLGPPTLVDGGFNGWRIPPSEGPVEVSLRWTAQTPLTVALLLSALAVVAALVLALIDRRSTVPLPVAPPRFDLPGPRAGSASVVTAGVVWVMASWLLIGPVWALVGAVGAGAIALVGRPRLAGLVTLVVLVTIAAVMVHVVRTESPWPDAGWPGRFEWLHEVGLFAAVSLLPALLAWPRRAPQVPQ